MQKNFVGNCGKVVQNSYRRCLKWCLNKLIMSVLQHNIESVHNYEEKWEREGMRCPFFNAKA